MTKARDVASLGGLTQVVPTSVTVGSGTATVSANGQILISGASNIVINGIFSSRFENYKLIMSQVGLATGVNAIYLRLAKSGVSSDTLYYAHTVYGLYSASTVYGNSRNNNADWMLITVASTADTSGGFVDFESPFVASSRTSIQHLGSNYDASWSANGLHNVKDSYDGIRIIPGGSTLSGSFRVYGYNNG